MGIRPEKITLADKKSENSIKIKCEFVELLGYDLIIHTSISGQKLLFKCESEKDVHIGDELLIDVSNDSLYFFDSTNNKRIK